MNDIVRGTFKGFAMLRQIALSSSQPGMPGFGQPQPVYVQGYGFVPLVLPVVGLWWILRVRARS